MQQEETPVDIPPEIQNRIKMWYRLFMRATYSHYFFGTIGVASSAISAATDGGIAKMLAALSATCIAILGFAQPDRKYVKFVRAWRILDIAALRYRYHQIDIKELLEAVERGEKVITDFENEISVKPSQKSTSHS